VDIVLIDAWRNDERFPKRSQRRSRRSKFAGSGSVLRASLWPACSDRSTNAPVWRPALRVGGSCRAATTPPAQSGRSRWGARWTEVSGALVAPLNAALLVAARRVPPLGRHRI